jgi:hypothetical protein
MAAYVGECLAQHLAAGEPGIVEPRAWLQVAGLRAFRMENARRAVTLDWVLRMALVATLLWPDGIHALSS